VSEQGNATTRQRPAQGSIFKQPVDAEFHVG
jgi:hypothetical protein